jgi:hypothetical protein
VFTGNFLISPGASGESNETFFPMA